MEAIYMDVVVEEETVEDENERIAREIIAVLRGKGGCW